MDFTDLSTRRIGRQPDHQGGVQPGRGHGSGQRPGLHLPQALRLLADAAGLCGLGAGGRPVPAGASLCRGARAGGERRRGLPREDPSLDWPCYRHDAFRSGSTPGQLPRHLKILWTAALGDWPQGAIAADWRWNHFIPGPVGPPVAAGGAGLCDPSRRPPGCRPRRAKRQDSLDLYGQRPRGHRADDPPRAVPVRLQERLGLRLRADDGRLVWRLRAAPLDERIVAYGQLESPWPVPGSVLVVDDVAYFAAGRQALADGGILVFAVEPADGARALGPAARPRAAEGFLCRHGPGVRQLRPAPPRRRRRGHVALAVRSGQGKMSCRERSGFARLATGGGGVFCPRGCWSYAAPNVDEKCKERPLAVFRDDALYSCSQDPRTLFRRDFHLADGEQFNAEWFAKWLAANQKHERWRSQRLSRGATWIVPLPPSDKRQSAIAAMMLAGDALCTVSPQGSLRMLDTRDGATRSELQVSPPAWDGLAAARGRVFLSTQDGRVVCLGK